MRMQAYLPVFHNDRRSEWYVSCRIRGDGMKKRNFIIKKNLSGWILLLPFLACITYTLWAPTVQGIIWSFFDMQGYTPMGFAGLKNYRIVMSDTGFLRTLLNTLLYVIWSLVIGYWVPFVLAVMLNEVIRGKGFFRFAMYLPNMAPGIAVSMLWYYMYYPNGSGLLNMLLGLVGIEPQIWLQNAKMTIPLILISSTWKSMGGTLLLYLAALQGVNRELYEAALVDGAGIWKRIVHVMLPQVSGILLLNLVRQILSVFQIMEEPLAMTGGGPNNASMSMGLLAYRYAFQNFKIGNALAVNVIMFVLLIILTLFYFKLEKKVNVED